MNFIRNRNFRAGPQTSLEGFICPQNSDKQQKIKVFGRSEGGENLSGNFKITHFAATSFVVISSVTKVNHIRDKVNNTFLTSVRDKK